jgi:hypothetical protein
VQDLLFKVLSVRKVHVLPKLRRHKVEKRVRHFEARPTSRPFFENFENGNLKFQIFLNKILDIGTYSMNVQIISSKYLLYYAVK